MRPLHIVNLILALPGLLASSSERAQRRSIPALARLLALAGPPMHEPEGMGAALAPRYGIARQDDWPLGSLRLAALGVAPGDAWWIAADPVALVAGRDDVQVAGVVDDLTVDESEAMVAALNAHFAADGLTFVAARPDEWFVRSSTFPQVVTHDFGAATGRALRALLPEGPDAGSWRRWLSEIQMLLHAHPVNATREASGRTRISSVWFSGGGRLPPRAASGARIATWANDGIATALALHSGAPAHPLPASLAGALRETTAVDTLVVALGIHPDLATIERAWCVPAWDALASGVLASVTLVADGSGDACVWTVRRPRRWQRWRARHTQHDLEALLDAARLPR